MIKFEHLDIVGWEPAIRGMRNAMNSWAKSDSFYTCSHSGYPCHHCIDYTNCKRKATYLIGPNDRELMMKLRKAGTDHRKYMRMVIVYVDIIAPLYWWKEFDTYKVGTVSNSCSTMHKIHDKEFTEEDFSIDALFDTDSLGVEPYSLRLIRDTIRTLNLLRDAYNQTKDKRYWDSMIQILPTSYNQRRTIEMNYEVLANIYGSRRFHKLKEWRDLCTWIEELPCSEIITGTQELKEVKE